MRPIQFDFANIVAQIVWIRNNNLVFGAVFESSGTFGEIDATQCAAIRINRCRHVALHPTFCLSWLRQLNGESIVAFCKEIFRSLDLRARATTVVFLTLTTKRKFSSGGQIVFAWHWRHLIGMLLLLMVFGGYDFVLGRIGRRNFR